MFVSGGHQIFHIIKAEVKTETHSPNKGVCLDFISWKYVPFAWFTVGIPLYIDNL